MISNFRSFNEEKNLDYYKTMDYTVLIKWNINWDTKLMFEIKVTLKKLR